MVESSGTVSEKPPEVSHLAGLCNFLDSVARPLTCLGRIIASTMIVAIMFLTFFDVGGRFALNKPITGSYELTEFMMSLFIGFGVGYCAYRHGLIRVDLIMQHTNKKTNAWIDVITYSASLIFYIMITWQCLNNAFSYYHTGLTSSVLYIPVYPFVFVLVIGVAILSLTFLKDLVQSINEVRKL
jgi:TRAP-type C4-dicarboxylate transport system permease small subunit